MERTKNVEVFERLLQTAIWSKVETRNTNWDNFYNFREKHPELKKLQLLIGSNDIPIMSNNAKIL